MASPFQDARFHLAAIVESSQDAIVSADLSGLITSWNPAAERIFGYTAAEAIGQPSRLIVPPDLFDEHRDVIARVVTGEPAEPFQTIRLTKDGRRVTVIVTVSPIFDERHSIAGVSAILRELTERDDAQRSAHRLAAIVESSDDAIVSKDLNGIVRSWNDAARRMFGYTAEEMIGTSIRRIVPPDRQGEEDEVLASVRRGQKVDHFDTIRIRKDGALIPISLTVSPIRDGSGAIIGASKIARDISERRAAEAERVRLLKAAQDHAANTTRLNQVGAVVASTLERDAVVQAVTDAATSMTEAEFGAFFYNVVNRETGEAYQLYTLSGAPIEAFSQFPHPRATAIFEPTFRGEGVVRLDDVTRDPRYGHNPPYHGMPRGHLPVRSYLAVPVKSRSGHVLGGLFFGHSEVGRFTEEHERLVQGVASWASVAMENARLYVLAQEANRLKDEFLATLSHELRTPLNAILGYARMLRSGLMTGDKQQRAFDTIERNATSLTQIVEDVLDVSRIVAGKIRLNVQQVELPDVVRHAIDVVRPAAEAKGVRLEAVLDPIATPVSGDPDRLQQVVWNLVSNAVKFTPKNGRVQIRLQRVNSELEVVVSDTGVGIPLSFLPFVFDRFRQAESSGSVKSGGLGLGLSIAKHLVELHGGRIEAASRGEGEGATFTVRLPLMLARGVEKAVDRVHPEARRSESAINVPDLQGIRVLVVDDDQDALRLAREILEVSGADVTTAASAAEALTLLAAIKAEVLIADLGMPHLDGFELIKQVRAHPSASVRGIRAAALSAFARSEDRVRALRSGFQLHLAKPIDPGELMAAVASLAEGFAREDR